MIGGIAATQRPDLPIRQEATLEWTPRAANGFLSALGTDDFELIRPHLKAADLLPDAVLVGWKPAEGAIIGLVFSGATVKLMNAEYRIS